MYEYSYLVALSPTPSITELKVLPTDVSADSKTLVKGTLGKDHRDVGSTALWSFGTEFKWAATEPTCTYVWYTLLQMCRAIQLDD